MTSLRHAVELCHELGTPYETAKARTALGEALRHVGDENAGRLEFESAKAAFERLGALPDAKRVSQRLGEEQGIAARAGERVTRTFVFTDIGGSRASPQPWFRSPGSYRTARGGSHHPRH